MSLLTTDHFAFLFQQKQVFWITIKSVSVKLFLQIFTFKVYQDKEGLCTLSHWKVFHVSSVKVCSLMIT